MMVSKDLLLAILSMHSYDRCYGKAIEGLGGLDDRVLRFRYL